MGCLFLGYLMVSGVIWCGWSRCGIHIKF